MSAPPKLHDRVREAIRVRHNSGRTEEVRVTWVRRFILFHGKRHPSELGAAEVARSCRRSQLTGMSVLPRELHDKDVR